MNPLRNLTRRLSARRSGNGPPQHDENVGRPPQGGQRNLAPGPYPLQGSLSHQGHAATTERQGGLARSRSEDRGYPGGFTHPETGGPLSVAAQVGSPTHPHPNGSAPQPPQIVLPNVEQDECYAWFVAVDQDGNEQLSPEELRSALLNDGGLQFSTRTVNYLMSLFDRDSNGTIGFEEFEPLWKYMTQWRQMFDSFDEDKDGRIDANELAGALGYYELHVGPTVLEMLVNKYGLTPSRNRPPRYGDPPRPQLDLDHFVCACVVVQQMCVLYDRCGAGGQGPEHSRLGRDEFIRTVISLP